MGVSSWPKGVKSQGGLALPHWFMELLPQTSMTWGVFHVVVFLELFFFFWDVCVCESNSVPKRSKLLFLDSQ